MVTTIIKRDGRRAEFRQDKIAEAVERAFQACGAMQDRAAADEIAQKVVDKLESGAIEGVPTVEGVQDLVEETLIEEGFVQTAKSYILYRAERSRARDVNSRLIQTLKDITFSKAADSDMKRENANIDADTAMGTMLKYGSESAKQFYEMCVIEPKFARAHREGDIHIHDMDFYTLTTTCCQIELRKLFKGGFSTGHGVLREPNDIASYAALACIAIQSNQNDQHGGQAICDFDYGLAEGVRKTYRRLYKKHLAEALDLLADGAVDDARSFAQDALARDDDQKRLFIAAVQKGDVADALRLRVRGDRHRRIIGEIADDFRHVFEDIFQIVALFADDGTDIVEVGLRKRTLFHQFFDIKAVCGGRRHAAARSVELRQIAQLFQRGEFVAHRCGRYAAEMLFGYGLARYGHGGIDILVDHDLQDFLFSVGNFHNPFLREPLALLRSQC